MNEYTFGDLAIGDMFNTKAARWVKISDDEALCVMSGMFQVGGRIGFDKGAEVVLLYSSILKVSS